MCSRYGFIQWLTFDKPSKNNAQETTLVDVVIPQELIKSLFFKMDITAKNTILTFHPDTKYAVREACKLEGPRGTESVDLLEKWILKQPHFIKKEYPRAYLEAILVTTKGSVEKAKRRIEKICTMRTFLPHLFDKTDARSDFMELHDIVKTVNLPKLTEDHYRISVVKLTGNPLPPGFDLLDFFKFCVIIAEQIKVHDCCRGFILVLDHRAARVMDFVNRINLNDLRNALALMTDGCGVSLKNLHFITPSKMIDTLVGIFKQVLSAKLSSRIHVHKGVETLYEFIPKSLLPEDLGGEEKPVSALYDDWLQELSSEDHIAHMKTMRKACTNEKLRLSEQLDEDMGISGTFRTLTFD